MDYQCCKLGYLAERRSKSPLNRRPGVTQSVKSLVVLAYEICTERIPKFRRFGSLKAYSILNCIEVVFWIVAVAMTGMGLGRSTGTTKALGAIILILGLALL